MRFTVQQLFGGTAVADDSSPTSKRGVEKLSVRVRKRRSAVAARNELLCLRDSIREVRRRDIELPHAGMQPLEGIGVVGW